MLTIKNFEKRLKEFIPNNGFRTWYIEDIVVSTNEYIIVLQKNGTTTPDYLKVALLRTNDYEMTEVSGELTYKLSFRNTNNTILYEHWVSKNWLAKSPFDFMHRIGEIIEAFVVNAPHYNILT